jgi:nicotinamide-nucleotide amidase
MCAEFDEVERLVERVASLSRRQGWRVAAAESLTGGHLAARLAAGPEASSWFRGAVVAYGEEVKFNVLGVDEGPVVTEDCARQMAMGVARLLGADAAVAATGVGGPVAEEGRPPGTVYVAVAINGEATCASETLPGPPEEVLRATVHRAISMLAEQLATAHEGLPTAP